MNTPKRALLVVSFYFIAAACSLGVEWPNPPNPLKLPAPEGQFIEFVPVFIGSGDSLIGTAEFVSGTAGTTPEETPTLTTVGGSFLADSNGQKDWFYYMATKEVTAALFNSVMRYAGRPEAKSSGMSDLPITDVNWFQVQEFLRHYNLWLRENTNLLPLGDDQVVAFVRLPTEAEWEFAARGGTQVGRETFDAKTPYGDAPVEQYEWGGGPASSQNELQEAGALKPNPLGLYDMLGNAAEMTATPFQLEPGQGPVGAMVRRGGNFRTPLADLRSSLRGEFLPYAEDGSEAGYTDLGFRLVVSGIVFSDIARVQEIKAKWQSYCSSRIVPMPGTKRVQPTSVSLEQGQAKLDEMTARQPESQDNTVIADMRAKVSDMTAQKFRSDQRSAQALVRLCSLSSFRIASNSALLKEALGGDLLSGINNMTKKVLDDHAVEPEVYVLIGNLMKMVTMFPEYKRETADNDLSNMLQVYGESLELLADIDPEIVEGAFAEQMTSLKASEIDYNEQLATTETARNHYQIFARERKFTASSWVQELLDSVK